MQIGEPPFGRVRHELREQGIGLRIVHAADAPDMRGQVQTAPPRLRNRAHQRPRHGRPGGALLLGEIRESQPAAGVQQRVLADQAVHARFQLSRQRIKGGPQVGKLGVSANRRHRAAIQHRGKAGGLLERTVGVPQSIPQLKEPQAIVLAPHLAIRCHVGDVGNLLAHPQLLPGHQRRHGALMRPEEPGKGQMLLNGQCLFGKDQHPILRKRLTDFALGLRVQRSGQVDVAHLGGKAIGHRRNGDRHGGVSCVSVQAYRVDPCGGVPAMPGRRRASNSGSP